jgi:hypothetical protein
MIYVCSKLQVETEEMIPFCSSFSPISMAAVYMINSTPLAKLTYFSRYCDTCTRGYAGHMDRKIASSLYRVRWPVPNSGAARWTDDISLAEKWFGWPRKSPPNLVKFCNLNVLVKIDRFALRRENQVLMQ